MRKSGRPLISKTVRVEKWLEHVGSDGGRLPLTQIVRQAAPSRTSFRACSRINRSIP